jgi:hypothetical protein
MTQQVRTAYRRHPRRAWGIALLIAVMITAVVIPIAIAGGDSGKTYTLGFAPNSALKLTLCGDAGSLDLILTNTAKSASLGSAEIKFPSFATVTSTVSDPLTVTKGNVSLLSTKNTVALRNLGLSKGQRVTVHVPFSFVSPGGSQKLVTVVKQSNNFNDSGGYANIFEPAPAPELTIVGCTTISGQVFQDRNGSLAYDATGSPADAPLAWNVSLYKKKADGTYVLNRQQAAGSDGTYTLAGVPTGSDYRLCVQATGADVTTAWALGKPTGNANCSAISTPSDPTSAANEITALSGPATGQEFAVVPVTAPVSCGGESSVAGYAVQLGNDANAPTSTANCTKDTVRYVQERFSDGGTIYFNFTPAPGSSTGEVLLVEKLEGTFDLAKGQSTVLKYDDTAPFIDYQPMPFCLIDPREDPATDKLTLTSNLVKSTVLPGSDTSCLIETHENVGPTGKFTRTDYVFSAVDGSRGMG